MPFTLRKRIKLFPGLYLNVSKSGVSVTTKVGPVTTTSRRGRTPRTTVDLPGPFGYVHGGKSTRTRRKPQRPERETPEVSPRPYEPPPGARFDPYS